MHKPHTCIAVIRLITRRRHKFFDVLVQKTYGSIDAYYQQEARSAYLPLLFILTGRFLFIFAPQGRHVAPIKLKFDISCQISPFEFISNFGSGVWVYGPILLKFRILAILLPPSLRGGFLARFLQNLQALCAP